jgi:hypothetical protein
VSDTEGSDLVDRVELSLVSDEVLLIETSDDNPSPPVVGRSTPTSEGGRGMLLVDALARRWGVRPDRLGTARWSGSKYRSGAAPPARDRSHWS